MGHNHTLEKTSFYFTLFAAVYFILAFTGFFKNSNSRIITGLFELLTIPLILSLIVIMVLVLYSFLHKGIKLTFYSIASFLISCGLILAMFFVK